MNLLFSCVGKRGYIADFFRPHLNLGERIIGTGNSKWTSGFASCDSSFILPDIFSEGYIDALLKLCEEQSIHAVLSFNDHDVVKLASARSAFENLGVVLVVPTIEMAEIAYDKYRMYEYLTAHGIQTPRTALRPDAASDYRYPLYVKPRRGSGSLETFVARNEHEMRMFFEYSPEMIIQETVLGEPFNIEICTDFSGEPVGICTWRKYRSRLGETEQAETFRDPNVMDFAMRLGRILRVFGPVDIDVFQCAGELIVLEANTRFGGGYPVSHLAGSDFPKLIVDLLRHGCTEPNFAFLPGVVMMKRLEVIGGESDSFFNNELRIR